MTHVSKDKAKLIARVRRIAGQVASLERALEAEAECGVVLHQVAAVRGAMQGLTLQLLEGHLREHLSPEAGVPDGELEPVLAILRSYLK
ncbi:metal/formaldehyde-sensitive transcriptional repressor [Frateuria sp. MAH-13]|uniref:Metal/formaldehyde-sensitive transcriptional repressor n=1 Tax=Frateuria flava TaxID=2821489 RepID=A0ABS4DQS8_9GAMM|nr:metal/formaldehyde-sensitive transcriptional repressor [Frateuria flava]MBP1475412.1 metal/formaldehyde-sensitive transcriptional repressor [Frateuria flava]